jgi:sugar/nucleoside kinase (ribokinase family)
MIIPGTTKFYPELQLDPFMTQSSSHDVVCAGILVADHVSTPIDHMPASGELILADRLALTMGGCAANVAVNLTKLGADAMVSGRVGDDLFAGVLERMIRDAGVAGTNLIATSGIDTSQTLIVNVKGEDRRFIHTFGANSRYIASDIPIARTKKVLYLGGYLLMGALDPIETAELFAEAQKKGLKTVLDVVTPGPSEYLEKLKPVLPFTDVFMPNDHEAGLITGLSSPKDQAMLFRNMGAKTVLITMGDRGTLLLGQEGHLEADTFKIEYVDGTGGGDAFAAGYIFGMIGGKSERECLILGSAVGASCVRAIGTTTGVFSGTELRDFLSKNTLTIRQH